MGQDSSAFITFVKAALGSSEQVWNPPLSIYQSTLHEIQTSDFSNVLVGIVGGILRKCVKQ